MSYLTPPPSEHNTPQRPNTPPSDPLDGNTTSSPVFKRTHPSINQSSESMDLDLSPEDITNQHGAGHDEELEVEADDAAPEDDTREETDTVCTLLI